jgi:hypothetical protein
MPRQCFGTRIKSVFRSERTDVIHGSVMLEITVDQMSEEITEPAEICF